MSYRLSSSYLPIRQNRRSGYKDAELITRIESYPQKPLNCWRRSTYCHFLTNNLGLTLGEEIPEAQNAGTCFQKNCKWVHKEPFNITQWKYVETSSFYPSSTVKLKSAHTWSINSSCKWGLKETTHQYSWSIYFPITLWILRAKCVSSWIEPADH